MAWNTATPAGSEAANQGDDRIREFKVDVQSAFRAGGADGVEGKFPGPDLTAPVFRYRGLKGATGARPTAGDYGMYFDETRNVLQRDNGSSWDDIATVIPSGTVMPFYQATAPVGWTQVVTQTDKVFRVVSGAGGGTGGNYSPSAALDHSHSVNSHTHTISHKHHLPIAYNNGDGDIYFPTTWSPGKYSSSAPWARQAAAVGGPSSIDYFNSDDSDTGDSGSATPGTSTGLTGVILAYIDVILASKD